MEPLDLRSKFPPLPTDQPSTPMLKPIDPSLSDYLKLVDDLRRAAAAILVTQPAQMSEAANRLEKAVRKINDDGVALLNTFLRSE